MTAGWTTRVGRRDAARLVLAAAMFALAPANAAGQTGTAQTTGTSAAAYEPQEGQDGKDVVWVPTHEGVVEAMLDIAKVTPADRVIDLGSGDGRTVIAAALRGARAHGLEYNPDMVALARRNAAAAGVTDRATFDEADLFEQDLSDATVITMFLLPSVNLELRPRLLDLRPGTRVVSNSFNMDDWEADDHRTIEDDCTRWCTALLWIVPAKVGGRWQVGGATLSLTQEFQMVTGTLGDDALVDGRLRGDLITFRIGETTYTGRVSGNTMEGTAGGRPWRASRLQP
jgi:SAM-dependent methyltransferase